MKMKIWKLKNKVKRYIRKNCVKNIKILLKMLKILKGNNIVNRGKVEKIRRKSEKGGGNVCTFSILGV